MKPINKTAAIIFDHLVSLLNGENHIKIDNSNGIFMPLSFEFLHDTDLMGQDAKIFAMAHYYEMNGDLIADPDMTFIQLIKSPEIVYPASITTQFGHRQSVWKEGKEWKINRREQADQTSFANQWLLNIRDQQELKIDFTKQIETFVNSVNSGEVQPRKCFKNFSKN